MLLLRSALTLVVAEPKLKRLSGVDANLFCSSEVRLQPGAQSASYWSSVIDVPLSSRVAA